VIRAPKRPRPVRRERFPRSPLRRRGAVASAAVRREAVDLSAPIMRRLGFLRTGRSRWRRGVEAATLALLLAGVTVATALLVRQVPGAPGPSAVAGPSLGRAMEGVGSESIRRLGDLVEQVLPPRDRWPAVGEGEPSPGGDGEFAELVAMAPWGSA